MANFFIDKSAIDGSTARITGEEAGHISRVLRMRPGDELTLCDGEGMFYDAAISDIQGGEVVAEISRQYPAPTEPKVKITLFQGIPKNPKLEFIVQKATEIGIVRVVPMNTTRAVAKLEKENKVQRLQKIAAEAAKQSHRGIVPEVSAPVPFEKAVEMAAEAGLAIIPYEEENRQSLRDFLRGKETESLAILIGPEGGFEESEVALAKEKGIVPVTLGPRILRTETAGLVTAALALYELGDMQ